MELVAASKMKRAVSSTLASRLYAEYSWEILTSIAKNTEKITSPLFIEREVKNVLLIFVTSNRGLCGAYNAQVAKKVLLIFKQNVYPNIDVITVGKKGDILMRRIGKKVIASFNEIPDNISIGDIIPISKLSTDEYNLGNYDKVLVAYTDFVSALTQKPNIRQVIPVSKDALKELIEEINPRLEEEGAGGGDVEYLFEGDMNVLIESLAEKIVRTQIYQMMLESNASEQSARMMAMKNASEASTEMIDDLTLVFNKVRQSGITREISEISAGMASMS